MLTQVDLTTIISIGSDHSSIVLTPSAECPYGTFDFDLIVSLADYPDVYLDKYFSVTIIDLCDISAISPPLGNDITGEVFTFI